MLPLVRDLAYLVRYRYAIRIDAASSDHRYWKNGNEDKAQTTGSPAECHRGESRSTGNVIQSRQNSGSAGWRTVSKGYLDELIKDALR